MYDDTGCDGPDPTSRQKTKGTRGSGFQKQTRKNDWKLAADESTTAGAGADTTGVNEPQNDQNDKDNGGINLEETFE